MSHKLVKIASLVLGNLLVALAVTCFIVPHGLVLGGSTGIALIVTHVAPLPLSLVVLVINAALFLLGAAFLGRSFAASTIFSTIAYPLAMSVLETLPLDHLTSEPMLAAVCAGARPGSRMRVGITAPQTGHPACVGKTLPRAEPRLARLRRNGGG